MLLYTVSVAGFAMYSESLTHIAAHRAACEINILHRDLSPGNIVIVPELDGDRDTGGGLLIDWDLCKVTDASANLVSARRNSRTVSSTFDVQFRVLTHFYQGTWQFMAAELIENPSIPHIPEHDLESVFWVLLWVTILYIDTPWSSSRRSGILDVMTPKVYSTGASPSKLHFLRDSVALMGLRTRRSPRVGKLLRDIHKVFCKLYIKKAHLRPSPKENESSDADESSVADESTDECTDEIGTATVGATQSGNEVEPEDLHATLIDLFNKALKKEKKWGINDVATYQPVEHSRDMESAAQSGPKRSRDMGDPSVDFNSFLPAKRLPS